MRTRIVSILITEALLLSLGGSALALEASGPPSQVAAVDSPTPAPSPSSSPSTSFGTTSGPRSGVSKDSAAQRMTLTDPTSSRSYLLSGGFGQRNALSPGEEFFVGPWVDVYYKEGETAFLAADPAGNAGNLVDDEIDVVVKHGADTSTGHHVYHSSCSTGNQPAKFNIAGLLRPGLNQVQVHFLDSVACYPGQVSATPAYVVIGGPYTYFDLSNGVCIDTDVAINPSGCTADPVNAANGSFVSSSTDLSLPGKGVPFEMTRSYSSYSTLNGDLGLGWTHDYETSLMPFSNGDALVTGPTGQQMLYRPGANCSFTTPPGSLGELTATRQTSPSYGSLVMADNPSAFWRLDDSNGATAEDATTNNLDGTYKNGVSLGASGISGSTGTAVRLDGVDDHIEVPNSAALNPSAITAEAWVKSTGATWNTYGWVVAKRDQYTMHPWPGSRRISFYVFIAGAWYWAEFTPASIQGWHHYVGTYSSGSLRLYIDGALVASNGVSGSISAGSGKKLYLGADLDGGVRYGAGDLDEIAIYDHALGASAVLDHYNTGSAQACPPPTSYQLKLKDGDGYVFDTDGKLTSIADRNGNQVALSYDASGDIDTLVDTAARSIDFAHDGAGHLTGETLPDGRAVSYGYTGGLLTSVTDVRGGTTTYSYDASKRLTEITDQNGHAVVTNAYGTNGRVTQQQDAEGGISTFSWDASTQTSTMTDARGKQWKDVYSGGVLLKKIDPLGNETLFERDSALNLVGTTDARGNETRMTYDARHNLLTRTAPAPLGYSETFTYDANNNLTSHTNARGYTDTFTYDAAGNLTGITRPGGVATTIARSAANPALVTSVTDPRGKTTSFEHDAAGNVTKVTAPGGGITTLTYDVSGRVTESVDPRGNAAGGVPSDYKRLFGYDAANHLVSQTDPLGNVTQWVYAADGRLTSTTDPKNRQTTYAYDLAHRLLSVTAPDSTLTAYSYDAVGNLTNRTDAKLHATSYTYDNANRLTRTTSPLGKQWTYGYDATSNLTSMVDARGNSTADPNDFKTIYSYDVANRLNSIDYSDATPDVTYSYDADSNRTQMNDGFGAETYAYDDLDRLTGITRGANSFAYAYDASSNVTSRSYPGSPSISYSYDDDSRLSSVTSGGATTGYSYDAGGHLVETAFPNGVVSTTSYDRSGRVTAVESVKGPTTLASATYELDDTGNPTKMITPQATSTYAYDQKDQLTDVCMKLPCIAGLDAIHYSYDAVGNRTTEQRAIGTTTYAYNDADQLTSLTGAVPVPKTFTYDANGNQLTSGALTSYTYDLANHMSSATLGALTTTYGYDGDGKRLRASTGTPLDNKRFLWDPNGGLPQLISERDGNDALVRRYVYGNDLILSATPSSTSYIHHDALGSVVSVTDSSGAGQWAYSYEPFGSARTTSKLNPLAPTNPMRFTGEYLDPTGLYHLRARQFDPSIGRFTTTDPLAPTGWIPYTSSYAYVRNLPTRLTDPSGLCAYISDPSMSDYLMDIACPPPGFGYMPLVVSTPSGLRTKNPKGECSGGLPDTWLWYDFTQACRTHDYAWDLVRFGAPGADLHDSNAFLFEDMQLHCDTRAFLFRIACRTDANAVFSGLEALVAAGGGPTFGENAP